LRGFAHIGPRISTNATRRILFSKCQKAKNWDIEMNLDDPKELIKLDSLGMFNAAESFPSQIVESVALATSVVSRIERKDFNSVIGCGMGGSAIGIDLVRSCLQMEFTKSLLVVRDYSLPRYVSDRDLVILVSYSGDTEETLSCLVEAVKRRSTILTVSSGGKLEVFSKMLNIPHVKIPSGYQPRAALGFLFPPLLVLLVHLGIAPRSVLNDILGSGETFKTVATKCSYRTPTPENPAKQLALKIFGSFPIVYGYGAYVGAALRFKQELNENSKLSSRYEIFPELDHNDIEGFDTPPPQLKPVLVLLRSEYEDPRIKSRIEETLNVIKSGVTDVVEVRGIGSGVVQLLTTIQICDSASLYLACLRGIDPGPVNKIADLKRALSSKSTLIEFLTGEVQQLSGQRHEISG